MLIRTYNTQIKTYYANNNIFADCNSITFINQGNVPVSITGGLTLNPNQSYTLDGNHNEIDVTNYQFWFATTNLPASPQQLLVIIRKFYGMTYDERAELEYQLQRKLDC